MIYNLNHFCLGDKFIVLRICCILALFYHCFFCTYLFLFMLIMRYMDLNFIYFSINSLFIIYLFSLRFSFLLFLFQKLDWRENWKGNLLPSLTAVINFQDAHPNLLQSNDSSKCTLQSVANLIRFYVFFWEKQGLLWRLSVWIFM